MVKQITYYKDFNIIKSHQKSIILIGNFDGLHLGHQSIIEAFGGSYGGYMVLASMTHYNERLSCAVDVVGISNFVTFLKRNHLKPRKKNKV